MDDKLGIGMIGYKFMGKAHSNAYRQISQFFDLPLKPRLKDHLRTRKSQSRKDGRSAGAGRTRSRTGAPSSTIPEIRDRRYLLAQQYPSRYRASPPSKPARSWPARSRWP